jgi:hypothetical protein
LPLSFSAETKTKTKTSKAAIVGLIFLPLSFITAALYSTQIVVITAILPVIFGIKSLVEIRISKGRLKGKMLAIFEIVIPICMSPIAIVWSMDAPPIPNDYTVTEFRSAPPDCEHSFQLLMNLSQKEKDLPDAPLIGLSAEDVNTIRKLNRIIAQEDYTGISEALSANSENVYMAWKNGQKGRDIISELNTFSEIADLTEITALTELDLDITYGFVRNLRYLIHLYQAYVYLEIEEVDEKNAINELIIVDSVFRKFSVNVRSMFAKLVCLPALAVDIRTANFIANNTNTSNESLELLAEHFQPFADMHTSFRNQFLFEYLTFKESADAVFYEGIHKRPSLLKRNSAIRLFKNFCDRWIVVVGDSQEPEISELSVWPGVCPNWLHVELDSEGNVPKIYQYYNIIGSMMVEMAIPAIERIFELKTKTEIHDDLLQIVLKKRLNREFSLKARAYSDEYIIDIENKKIFSPGPDGIPHNDDDIKLIINPQVLNFTN